MNSRMMPREVAPFDIDALMEESNVSVKSIFDTDLLRGKEWRQKGQFVGVLGVGLMSEVVGNSHHQQFGVRLTVEHVELVVLMRPVYMSAVVQL